MPRFSALLKKSQLIHTKSKASPILLFVPKFVLLPTVESATSWPGRFPVLYIFFLFMGKSSQGGVFGYLRGKVGAVSYSVLSGKNSSTGKKQQVVRALPEKVTNPQSAAQALQRMKLSPAQKFYAAFAALLSNAFQGVEYGEPSRRYFLSKCMTQDGPYVKRGVDRFIPAAYPFSEGSIPSVGIQPFPGSISVITLSAVTAESEVTPQVLADALGVSTDYQITVAIVNNVNGVFVPAYVGYEDRLRIGDMPAAALGKDAEGHITINPAALGLEVTAVIACCVVLSVQDASGVWLRSEQTMIISDALRASLYSADAMEAAIYSYQDTTTVNSINNEWYYNLGMSQLWPGKMTLVNMPVTSQGEPGNALVIVGIRQVQGRITRTVFAYPTAGADGEIICVEDNECVTYPAATYSEFVALNGSGYDVELWNPAYGSQINLSGDIASNALCELIDDNEDPQAIVDVEWGRVDMEADPQVRIPAVLKNSAGETFRIKNNDTTSRAYGKFLSTRTGFVNDAWTIPEDEVGEGGTPYTGKYFNVGMGNNEEIDMANMNTIVEKLGVSWSVLVYSE